MSKQRSRRPMWVEGADLSDWRRPYGEPVLGRGRGRSRVAREQAELGGAWRRMPIEKQQREEEEKEVRRTAEVTDRRSIDVRIMNNSDYSILYVIEYLSRKVRQRWLSPRTQADDYMKDAGGWPTLHLYYKFGSGKITEIDSYKPSKNITNLNVTIKNDGDILDVHYDEVS